MLCDLAEIVNVPKFAAVPEKGDLVQCDGNFDGLATEWRLTVGQPFKAGWCRGLKPSATISRHSVTNTKVNLAELR